MLIYHPVFDLNHGMFRLLRLLEATESGKLEWDTYQIIDMYYLFPYLTVDVGWPRAFNSRKQRYSRTLTPYNRLTAPKLFLQQIRGIHEAIVRSVAAKGFIEPLGENILLLQRSAKAIPENLLSAFDAADEEGELVEFLAKGVASIPAAGKNGLRERTRLMEHRYDAVRS